MEREKIRVCIRCGKPQIVPKHDCGAEDDNRSSDDRFKPDLTRADIDAYLKSHKKTMDFAYSAFIGTKIADFLIRALILAALCKYVFGW